MNPKDFRLKYNALIDAAEYLPVQSCRVLDGVQKYFLAQAPGSIEWYLIPVEEREHYIDWCKQEFFDDGYKYWKDRFEIRRLIDGEKNEREFIIV